MTELLEHRLAAAAALLELELQSRRAATLEELEFIMVNRTLTLVSGATILFWLRDKENNPRLERVSGVTTPHSQAEFTLWATQILLNLAASKQALTLHIRQLEEPDDSLLHALWCPLSVDKGFFPGGLLLLRKTPWSSGEIALMERLSETFAHAWRALGCGKQKRWFGARLVGKISFVLWIFFFISLGFIPINQSVLSPATVVAGDPWLVTAPMNGVIEKILVPPNAQVTVNQELFQMEQAAIRNRHEVAQQSLKVAQAELHKSQQQAFADSTAKASLGMLAAQIEERQKEVVYTEALLTRSVVRAQQAGIVILNDPEQWQGRPVQVGERILMIANPALAELDLQLSVQDAIVLEPGSRIVVFLNIDPLHPLTAQLYHAAYEATPTPEGTLAYRLRARFDTKSPPRIGLKATAKIIGQPTTLFYYLFRRPLTAVRQWIGW
ncbi:MAG: efflux RND transporter periplasmic adaptor subunit [Magnetococcus sp. DMHC-6]